MMHVSLFRDLPEEHRLSMEVYADRLAAGLVACFGRDLELRQVTLDGGDGATDRGRLGRALSRVRARFRRFVEYPRSAGRLQGDVNHIVDHGYADLALRMDRARTVVTCHDLVLLNRPVLALAGRRYSRMAMSRFRLYSQRGLGRCSRVIAVSGSTREDLIRHTDCSSSRIAVVPNGVGPEFGPIRDESVLREIRRRHGIPEVPVVLHVGQVEFYKNIEGLLRIFAAVRDRLGREVALVRVGPRLAPGQRALAQGLGLKGSVIETGVVERRELPGLYAAATVFLFPSLYEGFGMPPLEAMASGLPVVSSDAGSLREVIGEAGVLRAPTDEAGLASEVCALLRDRARREDLAGRGLLRSRAFTWQRSAEMTRAVYDQVISGRGPA